MSTKSARGTKRTCQSCEQRFYDLNRNPATCPMCGAVQAKETRESRRPVADDQEDELPVVPAARAGAAVAGAGATASGADLPEIVSIEDVPEIEGEDAEIESDGEEDTFLEEEEEDGDDVGTFIDNPIEGDEEEA